MLKLITYSFSFVNSCHANPYPPHHLIPFLSLSSQVDTFYSLSTFVAKDFCYYYTLHCIKILLHNNNNGLLLLLPLSLSISTPTESSHFRKLFSQPSFPAFLFQNSWKVLSLNVLILGRWDTGTSSHVILPCPYSFHFEFFCFSFIVFWFRIKVRYSSLSVVCIVLQLELLIRVIL